MSQLGTWTRRIADQPQRAGPLLFAASFSESLILPIPMELILIPYMLRHRGRIWWAATVVLIACLAGALVGYGIGAFFMHSLGAWAIEQLGWQQDFARYQAWFGTWGFRAVLAVGITPIPFQFAMLAAGAAGYPLLLFVLAAAIARGLRYYGLALLVIAFGEAALALWQRHARMVGAAVLVLVAALYAGIQAAAALLR